MGRRRVGRSMRPNGLNIVGTGMHKLTACECFLAEAAHGDVSFAENPVGLGLPPTLDIALKKLLTVDAYGSPG